MCLRGLASLTGLVFATAASAAAQTTLIDDFESGPSAAGWKFVDLGAPKISATGGNPGHYCTSGAFFATEPRARTGKGISSPFVGDLRARGVTNMSVDAKTDIGGTASDRFTLILIKSNDPNTTDDDDFAYFIGPVIPLAGAGWKHFEFAIPSASTAALPPGWTGGSGSDPNHFAAGVDWNDVITHVDRTMFAWRRPGILGQPSQWVLGIDNASVTYTAAPEPCQGDLDGDDDVDQSDLAILLGFYLSGPGGDLDGDGDTDQSDLAILLGKYLEPCP
jgi:hypothetical protein